MSVRPDLVLALWPGALPAARAIARALDAGCDLCPVRELRADGEPFGALAVDGEICLDLEAVDALELTERRIVAIATAEWRALDRLERAHRAGLPPLDLTGRAVLVVGVEGAVLACAVASARAAGARWIGTAPPLVAEWRAEMREAG